MFIWFVGFLFSIGFDQRTYEELEYPLLTPLVGYFLAWPMVVGKRLGEDLQADYLLKQKQLEEK